MTTKEMKALFDEFSGDGTGDDEFLKFDRIKNPAHRRPDICAFLMLDAAVPAEKNGADEYDDMVSAAEHDEIYLAIEPEELAKVATKELIRDLVRCGVRYDERHDCLAMFV